VHSIAQNAVLGPLLLFPSPSSARSFTTAAAAVAGRTFRPSEITLAASVAATLSTATGKEGGAGPPSLKRWRCVNVSASGRWRSARRRSGQRSSAWKSALSTTPQQLLLTTQPWRRLPRRRRRPSRLPHRGPSAGCSTRRKCLLQLPLRAGIITTGAGTGGLQRRGQQQRLHWPLQGPWGRARVAPLLQRPPASTRHTRPRVTRRRRPLRPPTWARAAAALGGSTRGASATPRTRTAAAMVATWVVRRARREGGRRDMQRPRLETRATGPSWLSRRSCSHPLRRRQRRRTLLASRRLICQTCGGFSRRRRLARLALCR